MEAPDGRVVCEIGIAMAVERLLRDGFAVAIPLVDDGYDLLAFHERRYWRLQVKATSAQGKNSRRIRIRRGAHKNQTYCPKHVDAFVLVNTNTRAIACVPVAITAGRAWFNWSDADRYADFGVLRRIKTQRC
jgi:hypothetical protein